MIVYYDRRGNLMGQASAVPPEAPLVRAQEPAPPVTAPAIYQDMAKFDDKVTLTKAALVIGGLVLVALTMTLSSSLLRRP